MPLSKPHPHRVARAVTATSPHKDAATIALSLCLLLPGLLACATSSGQSEFKLGFQDNVSGDGETRAPATTTPSRPVTPSPDQSSTTPRTSTPEVSASSAIDDHALGKIEPPSRAHLEYAQTQGLPLPTPTQRTAGPFEGPERSLIYLDHEARLTLYIPSFHTVYFARIENEQFKWLYGASRQGYFMFDQSNDYVGLSEPPEKLVEWPMAVESAQQVATFAERLLSPSPPADTHRDITTLSPTERATFWSQMQSMSEAFAAIPASRIASIGGKGCVAHYPHSYYIGCY